MTDPSLDRMTLLIRGLVEIMQNQLPAVDFADEEIVLKDGGHGAFGTGEASGPDRAKEAARLAMLDFEQNGGLVRSPSAQTDRTKMDSGRSN